MFLSPTYFRACCKNGSQWDGVSIPTRRDSGWVRSRRSQSIQYRRAVADGLDSTPPVCTLHDRHRRDCYSVPSRGSGWPGLNSRNPRSLTAADHPAHTTHSRLHYSVLFRSRARPCCRELPKVNAYVPNNLPLLAHVSHLPLKRLEQAQVQIAHRSVRVELFVRIHVRNSIRKLGGRRL